jgi:hypothetical protein
MTSNVVGSDVKKSPEGFLVTKVTWATRGQMDSKLARARNLMTKLMKAMADIIDETNGTIRINEGRIQGLDNERCKGDELQETIEYPED